MSPRCRVLPALLLAAGCASPVVVVQKGYDFQKVRRVAVVGVSDGRKAPGTGEAAAAAFEKELLAAGYQVVERRRVDDLLAQQRLSVSGAVDPKTSQALGRLLEADALVLGAVGGVVPARSRTVVLTSHDERREPVTKHVVKREKRGDQWVTSESDVVTAYRTTRTSQSRPYVLTEPARVRLSMRMVDAEAGGVLWSASASGEGDSPEDAAEALAHRIVKALKKTWPRP